MKYLRIFLLHFQEAFEYRSRSVVWFLLSLSGPVIFLLFWDGAFKSGATSFNGWNFQIFVSYYLLIVIANALLVSHVEYDVAVEDIKQGNLSKYLTRPFPYMLFRLLTEIPYRLLQGSFGILIFGGFLIFFPKLVDITHSPLVLILALLITFFGFVLCFLYKMILGLSAFWITETRAFMDLFEMFIVVFGGFLMPIFLLPEYLQKIASFLPFMYMFYYPVMAFLGELTVQKELMVIGIQMIWFVIFYGLYKLLWAKGVRSFTAVGQ